LVGGWVHALAGPKNAILRALTAPNVNWKSAWRKVKFFETNSELNSPLATFPERSVGQIFSESRLRVEWESNYDCVGREDEINQVRNEEFS